MGNQILNQIKNANQNERTTHQIYRNLKICRKSKKLKKPTESAMQSYFKKKYKRMNAYIHDYYIFIRNFKVLLAS